MLASESGVTPVLQIIDFFSHQEFDGLSQLFFEQESVKTHFGEHSFDIIQHGKDTYSLIETEFIISCEKAENNPKFFFGIPINLSAAEILLILC